MMNQKHINILSAILLFSGIIWFIRMDDNKNLDKLIEVIREKEFHGKVLKTYIDENSHGDAIAKTSTNERIYLRNFFGDVKVGDSLSKPKGTTIMSVYRNGKVRKLDFKIEIESRKHEKRTSR